MRRILLGAAIVALSYPANSAEMQSPAFSPSLADSPAWNWSGCYVGGQAGGLWATEDWTNRTAGGAFNNQPLGGHDSSSWVAGARTGCDYQLPGGFVVGIGGDYAWADASGSHPSAQEEGVFYGGTIDSLASLTGRVGYGWDRFLGYVKGGGAWEKNDYVATTTMLGTAYTSSDTRFGWTAGVGGEYAFTKFLSGFVEYDYYDFGTDRVSFTPQISGLRPAFVDIRQNTSIVHVGLNLRFGN